MHSARRFIGRAPAQPPRSKDRYRRHCLPTLANSQLHWHNTERNNSRDRQTTKTTAATSLRQGTCRSWAQTINITQKKPTHLSRDLSRSARLRTLTIYNILSQNSSPEEGQQQRQRNTPYQSSDLARHSGCCGRSNSLAGRRDNHRLLNSICVRHRECSSKSSARSRMSAAQTGSVCTGQHSAADDDTRLTKYVAVIGRRSAQSYR